MCETWKESIIPGIIFQNNSSRPWNVIRYRKLILIVRYDSSISCVNLCGPPAAPAPLHNIHLQYFDTNVFMVKLLEFKQFQAPRVSIRIRLPSVIPIFTIQSLAIATSNFQATNKQSFSNHVDQNHHR